MSRLFQNKSELNSNDLKHFVLYYFENPRTQSYGYVQYKISNPSKKKEGNGIDKATQLAGQSQRSYQLTTLRRTTTIPTLPALQQLLGGQDTLSLEIKKGVNYLYVVCLLFLKTFFVVLLDGDLIVRVDVPFRSVESKFSVEQVGVNVEFQGGELNEFSYSNLTTVKNMQGRDYSAILTLFLQV